MSLEAEMPCRAKCSAAWPDRGANFAVCACSLVSYSTSSSLRPRLGFNMCVKSMSAIFRDTSLIQYKHNTIPRTISSTTAAAGDGKSSAAAARALDGLPSGAEPTEDLIGGCGSGLGEVIKHCRSVSRNTIWSISLGSEAESISHLTTRCTVKAVGCQHFWDQTQSHRRSGEYARSATGESRSSSDSVAHNVFVKGLKDVEPGFTAHHELVATQQARPTWEAQALPFPLHPHQFWLSP